MQAGLALVGTASGLVAWDAAGRVEWLVGSALLFFVVPFTFVAIMGTNERLLNPALDRESEAARVLLVKWGRLHAVRSVTGGASFLVFVLALAA